MLVLLLIPAAIVGVFIAEIIGARRDRLRVATGRLPHANVTMPTQFSDSYSAATRIR